MPSAHLQTPYLQEPVRLGHGQLSLEQALELPRLAIEAVEPQIEQGRFAVKAIAGDQVTVSALIFADGHDKLAGEVLWRDVGAGDWHREPLEFIGNDRWQALITPQRVGEVEFLIEAWWDIYASYCYELSKKFGAGVTIDLELQEGELLLRQAAERVQGDLATTLHALVDELPQQSLDERVALLLAPETQALVRRAEGHPHRTRSAVYLLDVERPMARFASWYELFPRSETDDPERHGTLRDVIKRLPAIQAMGFDVLYFPPIHPIGTAHRKGRNNSLTAGPDDPGSPYAIGSHEGGHEAIHPQPPPEPGPADAPGLQGLHSLERQHPGLRQADRRP